MIESNDTQNNGNSLVTSTGVLKNSPTNTNV